MVDALITEAIVITEQIPDDIPEWAIKAMADEKLFSTTFERIKSLESERQLIIGWMYAEACSLADKGVDIREQELPEIAERAVKDLSLVEIT